ncbi:MAG: hypothetical protein A2817_01310 [Candidatus Yanofskybacteria bacterium RIFCSPHIGHO2_01_FULL_39_8b]|uniref:Uncharacterized protein n=1 Tax=Candidatus Yanofskybacteria bacterium RIFCSPHIGHO2_01_FULL_39_8b TaxID=1802659 RepID=A0A1F8EAW2_9BACT|nr:MAG: hypothetical protein A2817_01310 [Candidatus Yanofskybacteria bacterium RIFCSPHIGHO2_01_FULL_39_8b]
MLSQIEDDLLNKPVNKNYKVIASRHDIAEHIVGLFTALEDKEAKKKFEIYKNDPRYAWDWLILVEYHERVVDTWQKR